MSDIDLTGAVDMHLHTAPDVFERSLDDFDAVREADEAGMAALLLKSHHTLTADRAVLAGKGRHIPVFGGLALNLPSGGLNPAAVEMAIAFGARQIWMPTMHARNSLERSRLEQFQGEVRAGRTGISVLDADGRLVSEVLPVLEMIRDADLILGTGHLAPEESLVLLRQAQSMGLRKLLVTHPNMHFTRFSPDRMRRAVEFGALLEFDALSCLPGWPQAVDAAETARCIRRIGAAHCVLGSDGGQATNPHPVSMLRGFAESLSHHGLGMDDLRIMLCENPARLLRL